MTMNWEVLVKDESAQYQNEVLERELQRRGGATSAGCPQTPEPFFSEETAVADVKWPTSSVPEENPPHLDSITWIQLHEAGSGWVDGEGELALAELPAAVPVGSTWAGEFVTRLSASTLHCSCFQGRFSPLSFILSSIPKTLALESHQSTERALGFHTRQVRWPSSGAQGPRWGTGVFHLARDMRWGRKKPSLRTRTAALQPYVCS